MLALCEEDDVTLHGLVLAAGLTAVARYFGICLQLLQISHRLCHGPSSPPTTTTSLRAAVFTNLRQYCSPAPKNGVYTAPYEETYNVPPIVDSEDLWRLAHQLSMQVRFISTFTFFLHFGSNFHFLIFFTAAQHSEVNAATSPKAANVFQDVLRSWRWRCCIQVKR